MNNVIMDAHAWIEHKGVIIDPFFEHYRFIASIHNVTTKRNYVSAPLSVQEYYINEFRTNWNEYFKNVIKTPQFNACIYNCFFTETKFIEVKEKDYKIVMGSMGFGKDKIHWEYGNPDWKTIEDFKKR